MGACVSPVCDWQGGPTDSLHNVAKSGLSASVLARSREQLWIARASTTPRRRTLGHLVALRQLSPKYAWRSSVTLISAVMASAGLIGIPVTLTLHNPPNTVVEGLVANVNPQTSTLTLQNGKLNMKVLHLCETDILSSSLSYDWPSSADVQRGRPVDR